MLSTESCKYVNKFYFPEVTAVRKLNNFLNENLTAPNSNTNSYQFLAAGNILQNFCPCDTLVNFARVAFIVGVVTTFPLECFVCRDVSYLS